MKGDGAKVDDDGMTPGSLHGIVARWMALWLLIGVASPALSRPAAVPITRLLATGWQVRLAPGDKNAATHPRARAGCPRASPDRCKPT